MVFTVSNLCSCSIFKSGIRFLELLGRDEHGFDYLHCVAFRLLDAQWLVKRASYMEFNVSLLVCSVS
jgi:hypothetical protein